MRTFVLNDKLAGKMQVTLEINEKRAMAILEAIKRIKGVEVKAVEPTSTDGSYVQEFREAFRQTKLAEQGKLKLKTFDELIGEL